MECDPEKRERERESVCTRQEKCTPEFQNIPEHTFQNTESGTARQYGVGAEASLTIGKDGAAVTGQHALYCALGRALIHLSSDTNMT